MLKQAGRSLSRRIPASAGRWPYALALQSLQLAARATRGTRGAEIWARNSYVLGTLQPLVSDLDVTVWFEKEPSGAQMRQLAGVLRWTARVFPFLGEANVYFADEAKALSGLANPHELARDPKTMARLGPISRSGAKAAAFILRMLEGDIQNVLHRPEQRRAKWGSHFAAVAGMAASPPNDIWKGFPQRTLLRGIVELAVHMLELADGEATREAVESLERYFECVGRDVPIHVLKAGDSVGADSWWWALLPHRFCFGDEQPPRLTGRQAEIFVAQLSWEVWGILTQYRHAPSREKISAHLTAVSRALHAAIGDFSGLESRELISALERLSKSVQSR